MQIEKKSGFLVVDGVLYTTHSKESDRASLGARYGMKVKTVKYDVRMPILTALDEGNYKEAERLTLVAKIRGEL